MRLLNTIQQNLKVPKQANQAVKYKSRSAEDIVEMVKPLIGDKGVLHLSDEIVLIGDRYYVKATATLIEFTTDDKISHSVSESVAYAREDSENRMMSPAQLTGSTSSYARKYALNGLFAIDDTQDDDTRPLPPPEPKVELRQQISDAIKQTKTLEKLEDITKKLKASDKLTDKEKEALLSEADFQSMELTQE